MTTFGKVVAGLAVGAGLIWLIGGKKKAPASAGAAPPAEEPGTPPALPSEPPDTGPPGPASPPPLSDSSILDRERDAIESTNPVKIQSLADEVRGANRPTAGLDAWVSETTEMASKLQAGDPKPRAFYEQAIKSTDPITLVRAAAYMAAEGYTQAPANLLAMAGLRSTLGNTKVPKTFIQDAAEKGGVVLYGGATGVGSYAVAVEELRVMMSLDPGVYGGAGGVKEFLVTVTPKIVQSTSGLDKRAAELAAVPLAAGVADGIKNAIATADEKKLKTFAASLSASHKNLSNQLMLLAQLVGVTDMMSRVSDIRAAAEQGV